MPVKNQKYAFVTNQGWVKSLSKRWPDAPTHGEYKLLVFAGSDLASIESDYSEAKFKYLSSSETIKQMELGTIGPFICNLEQTREIAEYFTPDKPELTE